MVQKQKIILALEILLIFSFLLFVGSGTVISPFVGEINMIDEGQLGAWIRHMLHGEFLYKDIYAAYGPLYVYPAYLAAKVFGPSVFLIRVFYLTIYTFLAILILRMVLVKLRVGYGFALLVIGALLIVPGFGMRQGMGLLAIMTGYLAFDSKKRITSIIAGVVLALAYLISSEVGIFSTLILFLLFFLRLVNARQVKEVLLRIALLVLSSVMVFFVFYVWASTEGWFWSYLNSIISDMTIYSGIALPNGKSFPNIIELVPVDFSAVAWAKYIVSKELLLYWLFLLYIVTFLYLFIRFVLGKADKRDELVFLIAVYGFFLATILIGRSGHFSFTLAPAFILLAVFSDILFGHYKGAKNRKEKFLSLFILIIIFLFLARIVLIYRPHFPKIINVPAAVISAKSSPEFVGNTKIPLFQETEIREMQLFVAENTTPKDAVFFLGNEPMMYLLTNRDNPTRYDIPVVANTRQKRLEVLDDIKRDRTKYIIYNKNSWPVDEVNNFVRIPELRDYLALNYKREDRGSFILYTRIDP